MISNYHIYRIQRFYIFHLSLEFSKQNLYIFCYYLKSWKSKIVKFSCCIRFTHVTKSWFISENTITLIRVSSSKYIWLVIYKSQTMHYFHVTLSIIALSSKIKGGYLILIILYFLLRKISKPIMLYYIIQ